MSLIHKLTTCRGRKRMLLRNNEKLFVLFVPARQYLPLHLLHLVISVPILETHNYNIFLSAPKKHNSTMNMNHLEFTMSVKMYLI